MLNYGTKWHDYNFTSIYNKMEKFNNPNRPPEEMKFYTWEKFKQFVSVIDDIKWKTLFEVLFFCGLRRGELRGLTKTDETLNTYSHLFKNALTDITSLIDDMNETRINS